LLDPEEVSGLDVGITLLLDVAAERDIAQGVHPHRREERPDRAALNERPVGSGRSNGGARLDDRLDRAVRGEEQTLASVPAAAPVPGARSAGARLRIHYPLPLLLWAARFLLRSAAECDPA